MSRSGREARFLEVDPNDRSRKISPKTRRTRRPDATPWKSSSYPRRVFRCGVEWRRLFALGQTESGEGGETGAPFSRLFRLYSARVGKVSRFRVRRVFAKIFREQILLGLCKENYEQDQTLSSMRPSADVT
jgi:hypothetical protein